MDPLNIIEPQLINIWAEFQSTFQLVLKGLIIGIIVSAPMGPTGILCLQRTINKGRDYGLVTGAGAATSDLLYAAVTGFGMSFVMDFIDHPENIFWLKVIGSALLLIFGIIVILNPLLGLGVIGVLVGCSIITAGVNLIYLGSSPWLL